MNRYWMLITTLVAFLSTLGCTTSVERDPAGVGGSLRAAPGYTVPERANIKLIWQISSGSPDYSYAYGDGISVGTEFSLDLGVAPPAEALNSYGVGVAVLVLFEDGVTLPDGNADDVGDDELLVGAMRGASGMYSIVYVEDGVDTAELLGWERLPAGFSCVRGVPADAAETFDTFELIECAELEVTVGNPDEMEFTNWT